MFFKFYTIKWIIKINLNVILLNFLFFCNQIYISSTINNNDNTFITYQKFSSQNLCFWVRCRLNMIITLTTIIVKCFNLERFCFEQYIFNKEEIVPTMIPSLTFRFKLHFPARNSCHHY